MVWDKLSHRKANVKILNHHEMRSAMNQSIQCPYHMSEITLMPQLQSTVIPTLLTPHNVFMSQAAWHNQIDNQILFNFITVAKKLEANKLKLLKGRGINAQLNSEFIQFADNYGGFMQRMNWLNHFKANPYLKTQLDVHAKLLRENLTFAHPTQYYSTLYHYLVSDLLNNKCGIKAKEDEKFLKAEFKIQKKLYKTMIRSHEQLNCLFVEIPCLFNAGVQLNLSCQRAEQMFSDSIQQLCSNLRTQRGLLNRLCNIQWRIVKAYDDSLIAHLQIFILGEQHNYNQLIQDEWDLTCAEMILPYDTQLFFAFSEHCYYNDGFAQEKWNNLIERYQAPLFLYRYKNNGITFEWQTMSGNV